MVKLFRILALFAAIILMFGCGVCGAYAVLGNVVAGIRYHNPYWLMGVAVGVAGLLLAFVAAQAVRALWSMLHPED